MVLDIANHGDFATVPKVFSLVEEDGLAAVWFLFPKFPFG